MAFNSGERNPRAVLTWEEVEWMRALRDEGFTQLEIAIKMERSRSTVRNVVNYLCWVEAPPYVRNLTIKRSTHMDRGKSR